MNHPGAPPPYPAHAPTPQKKSGLPVWLIVLLIVVPLFVAIGGVLVVLGVYGTRKYIANAKTAEARSTISVMARAATEAFESRGALCPSASSPVPASTPRAAKYQSSPADWSRDSAADAGFACLKFSMDAPQYYQYEYRATATGFTVTAHGDLDGDGVVSTFEVEGRVTAGRVLVSPAIQETNPEE